jgi:hypothetical protein
MLTPYQEIQIRGYPKKRKTPLLAGRRKQRRSLESAVKGYVTALSIGDYITCSDRCQTMYDDYLKIEGYLVQLSSFPARRETGSGGPSQPLGKFQVERPEDPNGTSGRPK